MMHHKFGFGPGFRSERFFHRGGFKFLILDLLKDKPRYGYEIIRELEEKFHGFYAPSPGIVYPTLQWLEEVGYVTASQQENKKIYTITDEGRKFLEDQKNVMDEVRSQWRENWSRWSNEARDELHEVRRKMAELGRLLAQRARNLNAENLRHVREILGKAYDEIAAILRQ
jgi:DNA-binding PadR family transcriptional regulator